MGDETGKEPAGETAPAQPPIRRLNGTAAPAAMTAPPSGHSSGLSGEASSGAPQPSAPGGRPGGRSEPSDPKAYWRANIRLMLVLLSIWALVSFGFGIWLREPLDALSIGGAPLGFWFAQQGSIYVFVVLIFVYVWGMKRLDDKFDVEDASELKHHHHSSSDS